MSPEILVQWDPLEFEEKLEFQVSGESLVLLEDRVIQVQLVKTDPVAKMDSKEPLGNLVMQDIQANQVHLASLVQPDSLEFQD